MLEMYDFTIAQVRYVKAAMEQIPAFRPDYKTPADVAAMIPNPDPVRTTYVTKKTVADAARDARNNGSKEIHDVCVDFLAQARSVYRKNPAVVQQLGRITVKDQTFQECLTRADQTSALWGTLPNVPTTPPGPFKVLRVEDAVDGAVLKADLDALIATARAADIALPPADTDFQKAEAELHRKHDDLDDFVTAALAQARSQFGEGSSEREIINSIPTQPATQAPDKAVITEAVVLGPAEGRVSYEAPRATSFDVYRKNPGQPAFLLVAEDDIRRSLTFTDLTAGITQVKVVGRNSRGTGPESTVAQFNLAG